MTKVVVIGAGNAGIAAALSAKESGAEVEVIEWAAEAMFGSDSYFSGGLFRVAYDDLAQLEEIVGGMGLERAVGLEEHRSYDRSQFLDDWARVTEYRCDADLAEYVIANSYDALRWLSHHKVPFISPLIVDENGHARHSRPGWHGGFLEVSGAGVGLIESLTKALEREGLKVSYETQARGLTRRRDGGYDVLVRDADGFDSVVSAEAVIIASGGFQADSSWRTSELGPGWDMAKVRGSALNTGLGIRMALDAGARANGNWSGCHAVAWSVGSGDAGRADANHVFERESHPFGITVNSTGQRFLDEGSDFGAYTYAKYGRLILQQPGQRAWQIFDQVGMALTTDEYHYKNPEAARVQADTLEELARRLREHGLDHDAFLRTVAEYNAAASDTTTEFNPYVKDGKATRGLAIEKTNWANPITEGPFVAYEMTCGITFTFGGLAVNTDAAVLDQRGRPMPGLFACGEAVGGLYYFNYASGTGLTAGTVLGRTAGKRAAAL